MIVATSQLGFAPRAPKPLAVLLEPGDQLPPEAPFVVNRVPASLPRAGSAPADWTGERFPWPFDIADGGWIDRPGPPGSALRRGVLRRVETAWGPQWMGEIDAFAEPGIFQIEAEAGFSYPFVIDAGAYERLLPGFLLSTRCQRSGFEVPGVRPLMHADDAVRDDDGRQLPLAGGWNDAGDARKTMATTQPTVEALALVLERGAPGFREAALDEARWGNRFFHGMIDEAGQVFEDVGAGELPAGYSREEHWWFENHAGIPCDASGRRDTDNVPGSGDERRARTAYNAFTQFEFAKTQAILARVLEGAEAQTCRVLAERAYAYGRRAGHDDRTLFLAEQLLAAAELRACGSGIAAPDELDALTVALLARQDAGAEGLRGYFLERDERDAFRAITFSCEPAMALLRVAELGGAMAARLEHALAVHLDDYLLADARSNPFRVTPYGVYVDPPDPDRQRFRDAGRGRGVRTFMAPFNAMQVVHGTLAVRMHQAHLLARAATLSGEPAWREQAERLLAWATGHNPAAMSLFTGVGFRHPAPFSAATHQVPGAAVVGFIGRPDDTPYLELGPAVRWNTQEVWNLPSAHAVGAVLAL